MLPAPALTGSAALASRAGGPGEHDREALLRLVGEPRLAALHAAHSGLLAPRADVRRRGPCFLRPLAPSHPLPPAGCGTSTLTLPFRLLPQAPHLEYALARDDRPARPGRARAAAVHRPLPRGRPRGQPDERPLQQGAPCLQSGPCARLPVKCKACRVDSSRWTNCPTPAQAMGRRRTGTLGASGSIFALLVRPPPSLPAELSSLARPTVASPPHIIRPPLASQAANAMMFPELRYSWWGGVELTSGEVRGSNRPMVPVPAGCRRVPNADVSMGSMGSLSSAAPFARSLMRASSHDHTADARGHDRPRRSIGIGQRAWGALTAGGALK